jgi:hypothetical protein
MYDSHTIDINVIPHGLRLLVPEQTPRELFMEDISL